MNDADIMQNELDRVADAMSLAEKRFEICFHGSRKGPGWFDNVKGEVKCLDCGKVATWEVMEAESQSLMMEYT